MAIKRTVLPFPGIGTEFIYTTSEGEYIGRCRFEAMNAPAMEMMARDVLDFLDEQQKEAERPKIAIAVTNGMRGN